MRSINKNLKKNRKSNKTRKRTFSKSKQTGGHPKAIVKTGKASKTYGRGPRRAPSRAGKNRIEAAKLNRRKQRSSELKLKSGLITDNNITKFASMNMQTREREYKRLRARIHPDSIPKRKARLEEEALEAARKAVEAEAETKLEEVARLKEEAARLKAEAKRLNNLLSTRDIDDNFTEFTKFFENLKSINTNTNTNTNAKIKPISRQKLMELNSMTAEDRKLLNENKKYKKPISNRIQQLNSTKYTGSNTETKYINSSLSKELQLSQKLSQNKIKTLSNKVITSKQQAELISLSRSREITVKYLEKLAKLEQEEQNEMLKRLRKGEIKRLKRNLITILKYSRGAIGDDEFIQTFQEKRPSKNLFVNNSIPKKILNIIGLNTDVEV
jgi:hypothetical protein